MHSESTSSHTVDAPTNADTRALPLAQGVWAVLREYALHPSTTQPFPSSTSYTPHAAAPPPPSFYPWHPSTHPPTFHIPKLPLLPHTTAAGRFPEWGCLFQLWPARTLGPSLPHDSWNHNPPNSGIQPTARWPLNAARRTNRLQGHFRANLRHCLAPALPMWTLSRPPLVFSAVPGCPHPNFLTPRQPGGLCP
jgi:hypothetical protein